MAIILVDKIQRKLTFKPFHWMYKVTISNIHPFDFKIDLIILRSLTWGWRERKYINVF